MTVRVSTLQLTIANDAAFRAFCQIIHDNFVAAGLVQTSDPQANLTTVTKPASSYTVATNGSEVWRFNDALQATAPLFIKVEYGVGATTAPNLWITVGTGSDGAGNLTYAGWPGASSVMARQVLAPSGSGASTKYGEIYFTYLADGSWGLLTFPSDDTSGPGVWLYTLERFRNPDGSGSPDGVTSLYAAATGATGTNRQDGRFYVLGGAQTGTPGTNNWQTVAAYSMGTDSTVMGRSVYPSPVFTGMAPRLAAPSQFVVALAQADVPGGQKFLLESYGPEHQWISAGVGAPGFGNLNGGLIYRSFAMRID